MQLLFHQARLSHRLFHHVDVAKKLFTQCAYLYERMKLIKHLALIRLHSIHAMLQRRR